MTTQEGNNKSFYFSTHNLLIMAVLAALGGVTGTYINALGDLVQAALGFPGGTQWAAGLHVLWIVIAFGIIQKPGTGIVMGILKGAVELFSGNSHGIIILLVDLIAGILVDFGFLLFRNKRSLLAYLLAGGLASGSNVLVFQIFATIPLNILGLSAIAILFLLAALSGFVFAGLLPYWLINMLTNAGVVKLPTQKEKLQKLGWIILFSALIFAAAFISILLTTLKGAETVKISGAVENAIEFPNNELKINKISRQMDYRGVLTSYEGFQLSEIINYAEPNKDTNTILIEASDGYAFMISLEELIENENILLVQQGRGQNASFDIVGPESNKAWVRNVIEIRLIAAKALEVNMPQGGIFLFEAKNWISEMDSTQIALPEGSQKLQGVPVWKVIEASATGSNISQVLFKSETGQNLTLDWEKIDQNNDIRLFILIEDKGISYVLAEMTGDVLVYPVSSIEIN